MIEEASGVLGEENPGRVIECCDVGILCCLLLTEIDSVHQVVMTDR